MILAFFKLSFVYIVSLFSMPEASAMEEHYPASDQPSVSVGEVVGRSIPGQQPLRRVKFLVEWRDQTIPIVLEDSDTIGNLL